VRSLADCVKSALAAFDLTPAVRVDLAQRHDPRADAIVVTPYAGRPHPAVGAYSFTRLQVLVVHRELDVADSLAQQLHSQLTALFGEMDGKVAIWDLDEWESRQTTATAPIYLGEISPEKSTPRYYKYGLTLELFARRVEA
jgi:hypothetical protein